MKILNVNQYNKFTCVVLRMILLCFLVDPVIIMSAVIEAELPTDNSAQLSHTRSLIRR